MQETSSSQNRSIHSTTATSCSAPGKSREWGGRRPSSGLGPLTTSALNSTQNFYQCIFLSLMKARGIEPSRSRGVPKAEGCTKCPPLLLSVGYSFVTASSDLKNYGGCRNRSHVGRCSPNQNLDSHPRDEGRPVSSLVASQGSAGRVQVVSTAAALASRHPA